MQNKSRHESSHFDRACSPFLRLHYFIWQAQQQKQVQKKSAASVFQKCFENSLLRLFCRPNGHSTSPFCGRQGTTTAFPIACCLHCFCQPPNAVPIRSLYCCDTSFSVLIFSPLTSVHSHHHHLLLLLQVAFCPELDATMSKEYDHLFKLLIIGDSGKKICFLCNVHAHR